MKFDEIKTGALISYFTIVIQILLGIFYVPFLVSSLGQSQYGLYSLANSIVAYLYLLDFGFGQAVVVYSSKSLGRKNKDEEYSLYAGFVIFYLIVGVISLCVGLFLYQNFDSFFAQSFSSEEIQLGKILLLILTFNTFISLTLGIFGKIITVYEKFIFAKCINLANIVLTPCVMIPFLIIGCNAVVVVSVITATNALSLFINAYYCIFKLKIKLKFNALNKSLITEIIGFSAFVFLASTVEQINTFADNIILGLVCGTSVVAVYSVGMQFVRIYRSISLVISSVLLPKSTKMESRQANDREFSDLFIDSGRMQFIILFLILSGFILFGKAVIIFLFGQDYSDSYYIACIIMIPMTIPHIQLIGVNILLSKNKNQFRTVVYFFIAILNIIVSYFIAHYYGAIGAASVTAFAVFLGHFIIMNIYYAKIIKLDIKRFWLNITKMMLPVFIIFILWFLVRFHINCDDYILIEIFVYAILYFLAAWKFSLNNKERSWLSKYIKGLINF